MNDVIAFWFEEIQPSQWWAKEPSFDALVTQRFLTTHQQASAGELVKWRSTSLGRLAEILVLDQFSRNMYRDTPQSFAYDTMALVLAQEAVNIGADKLLTPTQRSFLYMPYMHSESLVIHQQAIELFDQEQMQHNLDFEVRHKNIIEQFGRYPHRNDILGRQSTPQEVAFLAMPNSSF